MQRQPSSSTPQLWFYNSMMGTNLRPQTRHGGLDEGSGPASVESTPFCRDDPQERNDIKSYASRAFVPYIKDDERPTFAGAQGAVYRATRTTTNGMLRRTQVESFAIKEIRLADVRARDRLRNEVKHLRLCDHPNVLRLREAYTIEQEQWIDTTFLVTEPWAQSSLQRFLQNVANDGKSSSCPWYTPQHLEPWPSIVEQCILGVKHLHQNGIKHKDLKPDNILLLDESGGDYLHPKVRPIIADLGISKENIVGAKTTFQGTYQYLAPEQIAEEASLLESDIFSLGCCFAWIHSVLSSKPWNKDKPDEQGPSQLDELASVGFASVAAEVSSLLERLRADQPNTMKPERMTFLLTLEEMVSTMLVAAPVQRAKIEQLLEQLNLYTTRCRLLKKKKSIHLCITNGQSTHLSEIDVSDVSTDAQFFDLVRRRILSKIFGIHRWQRDLGIYDVRFIKFIMQDGVFGVLEGPNSIPPPCVLLLGDYECNLEPAIEVPVPRDLFIHSLSCSSPGMGDFWFDRIPKRVHITSRDRVDPKECGSRIPEDTTIPKKIEWGIEIVQDTFWYPALFLGVYPSYAIGEIIISRYYTRGGMEPWQSDLIRVLLILLVMWTLMATVWPWNMSNRIRKSSRSVKGEGR